MGINIENLSSDVNNKMTCKISGTGENRSYVSVGPAPSSANKRFTEEKKSKKSGKRSNQ